MSDETASETPMTIEERLAYLEEQNEGLKKVGKLLLALCLLTAGLLVYTQNNLRKSVHSEAVILGGNAPRAALTTSNDNGHLAYLFFDHLGIIPPEPKFGAVPFLDGFVIYDRQGNPRIVIGVNDKNEAVMDVVAADGRVEFSARPRSAAPAEGATPGASGAAPVAGASPAPTPAPAP
jgi:hypothetical protein